MEELRVQMSADGARDVVVIDQRLAIPQRRAVTSIEPEHETHRRGLPGTVGAEESGHHTGLQRERQLVDRASVAVALAEPDCLDAHSHLRRTRP